jgi:hypothetical protein
MTTQLWNPEGRLRRHGCCSADAPSGWAQGLRTCPMRGHAELSAMVRRTPLVSCPYLLAWVGRRA